MEIPKANLEKPEKEKLTPVALGFMKILKPHQPLQTGLKMINRLAAGKKESHSSLANASNKGRGSINNLHINW